jgi:hypothetical protein
LLRLKYLISKSKILTTNTQNLKRAAQALAPREHEIFFFFRVFVIWCFRGEQIIFALWHNGLSSHATKKSADKTGRCFL